MLSVRETLRHDAEGWCVPNSVEAGYDGSLLRYSGEPHRRLMHASEEIRADIRALEEGIEGLLDEPIGGTP